VSDNGWTHTPIVDDLDVAVDDRSWASNETIALPRFLERKALCRLQVMFAFSLLAWRVGLVFCPLPAGAGVIVG
jgi:hypothetical protein